MSSETAPTTAAEVTAASTYKCDKASGDEQCVTMLGAGSCCFWAVVDSIPANRTA